MLHLKMLFDLGELLEILTAAVTPEGSQLGAGVGGSVTPQVGQVHLLLDKSLLTPVAGELHQVRVVHLLVVEVGHLGVEGEAAVRAGLVDRLKLLLLLLVSPLAAC